MPTTFLATVARAARTLLAALRRRRAAPTIADEAAAQTRVEVFHNPWVPAMLHGYQAGQPVTAVFTYTSPRRGVHDVLTEAFELLNIGDDPSFGTPDPRAVAYRRRGNRSLSVGDVVGVNAAFFACEPRGWRRLPTAPPLAPHAGPRATPRS